MKAPFDIKEGFYKEETEPDFTLKKHLEDAAAEADVLLLCSIPSEKEFFKIFANKYDNDIVKVMERMEPLKRNMAIMLDISEDILVKKIYSLMSDSMKQLFDEAVEHLTNGDTEAFVRTSLKPWLDYEIFTIEDFKKIPADQIERLKEETFKMYKLVGGEQK